MSRPPFSVVVLTRNRRDLVCQLLDSLLGLRHGRLEIIVVDNASSDGTLQALNGGFPNVTTISLASNQGAVARNFGLRRATGDIVICLDDDVIGLTDQSLDAIQRHFNENPKLAALNFRILDASSGEVANWCHPCRVEDFASRFFLTCEISEGAVAFRRGLLGDVGYYPEAFFISNEGADLACRILNHGYDIAFTPQVPVLHKFSAQARESWRRYYYDTRNHLWLAIRNYRLAFGTRYVLAKLAAMLVYSIRDGFFRYWLKGVFDAIRGSGRMYRTRQPLTPLAHRQLKRLRADRPGFFYVLRKRLALRTIRI